VKLLEPVPVIALLYRSTDSCVVPSELARAVLG